MGRLSRKGTGPPMAWRRSFKNFASGLSSGSLIKGQVSQFRVLQRHMETVAKNLQRLHIHLLDIVGHHHRFPGLTHAKPLDGLHQDNRWAGPGARGPAKAA